MNSEQNTSETVPDDTTKYSLLVDMVQKLPACALVQASAGTDYRQILWMFDCGTWVLAPNDNMKIVRATMVEWKEISRRMNDHYYEEMARKRS